MVERYNISMSFDLEENYGYWVRYEDHEAALESLESKLRKYGGHTANCAYTLSHYKGPVNNCDCGWTQEVTSLQNKGEQ